MIKMNDFNIFIYFKIIKNFIKIKIINEFIYLFYILINNLNLKKYFLYKIFLKCLIRIIA